MRATIAGLLLISVIQSAAAQGTARAPAAAATIPPATSGQAASTTPAQAVTEDGAAAVRKLAMVLNFARLIGVTGVEKSPTAAGKQLAIDVATSSAAMLAELKATASVSGYASAIPNTIDAKYAAEAELLQSSFETQFEHEYLGMQIAAHREAIGALEAGRKALAATSLAALEPALSKRLAANLSGLEAAKRALPAM